MHRQCCGRAAERAVEVTLCLRLCAEPMGLGERRGEGLLRIVLEVRVLDEAPGKRHLNKVGNIVAVRSMPVEDAVDAEGVHPKNAEVVLVALRLQAFLASVADLVAADGAVAASGRRLVGKALLPRLRGHTAERGPPVSAREKVKDVALTRALDGTAPLGLGVLQNLLCLQDGDVTPVVIDYVVVLRVAAALADAHAHSGPRGACPEGQCPGGPRERVPADMARPELARPEW
mmetsp:Transcript_35664/g.80594  ORF Transcript_35664/g.80594 Transcript_35664/m.80594 type:complete len:232 (-) Transcript_35664:39-734(-)